VAVYDAAAASKSIAYSPLVPTQHRVSLCDDQGSSALYVDGIATGTT
jgi:hypothetical protein